MNTIHKCTLATASFAAALLAHPTAHAHIDMKGPLMSRGGDQKHFPCDGNRGDGPIYTFEPGSTIVLSVDEVIPHPSYFRIAFDNDGEDAFVEPKSIKPIDPSRACPFDANDKCGEADYCNVKASDGGATVLWDNLDPHLAGGLKSYSWTVKLPNVECENCVLQVLQIMEDTIHGAYCPTGSCMDSSLEDIYHRCVDIKLKKGATNSPGIATSPMMNMGMQCVPDMPAAGAGARAGAGGASGGAGGMTAGAPASAGSVAMPTAGAAAGTGASAAGARASTPTAGSMSAAGGPPTGASAGTSPSGTATGGAGGTSAVGMSAQPNTGAGAAGMAAPAPAPSSSGGCSTARASGANSEFFGASLLIATVAASVRRRRRGAKRNA